MPIARAADATRLGFMLCLLGVASSECRDATREGFREDDGAGVSGDGMLCAAAAAALWWLRCDFEPAPLLGGTASLLGYLFWCWEDGLPRSEPPPLLGGSWSLLG